MGAVDQALFLQPAVLEGFRKIFIAGVADEGDDVFRRALPAAPGERAGDQGAGRTAGQNALDAQQVIDRLKSLAVGHHHAIVDHREVEIIGNEILADAFDQPGPAVIFDLAGFHRRRHHRADRVGDHHFHVGVHRFQITAGAGDCPARADPGHQGVDLAVHLLPDFRAGGGFMRLRIGRVVELVGPKGAGRLGDDLGGHVLIIFRMAFRHVRAGQTDLGAKGAANGGFSRRSSCPG